MKAYGFSPDFIDWELDGSQGWAYANWARQNEATMFGGGVENKSPGYIKQEWKRLMDQYYGKSGRNIG